MPNPFEKPSVPPQEQPKEEQEEQASVEEQKSSADEERGYVDPRMDIYRKMLDQEPLSKEESGATEQGEQAIEGEIQQFQAELSSEQREEVEGLIEKLEENVQKEQDHKSELLAVLQSDASYEDKVEATNNFDLLAKEYSNLLGEVFKLQRRLEPSSKDFLDLDIKIKEIARSLFENK